MTGAEDIEKRKTDFLLVEYKEAANAYFQGTNIGWTGLRFYVTLNVFIATAIIFLAKEQQPADAISLLKFSSAFSFLFSVIGIMLAVAMYRILPHYSRHLNNCRQRAEKIEQELGGKLFTEMGGIETRGYNATNVVNLITACPTLIWTGVAIYYLWTFSRTLL